ncbi:dipeptide transport system substrate-binding protein [Arboricoccus pini]|uniref:Dipeptide transport system substrate-binding protein n=1 Tax=Arboricoccus pini TaxID=1963835 RepID=A0A212QYP3_9PROT|nr:dipeptide transport system substrate-binding protein [Arboricoccus pini]
MRRYRHHLNRALMASCLMLGAGLVTPAMAAKTLVYCSEGSPEGFNPQMFTAGTTFDASSQPLYDRLFNAVRGTTEIEPSLATGVDVSADGKVYTFHLRPGVKFHTTKTFKPTRGFNADDVVFSVERMADKNSPYHMVGGGSYEYYEGSGLSSILDKVEKVDDMTVRFTLKSADATFLPITSMDFMSILSKEYADQMQKAGTPDKVDQDPVGTGPFQLVAYQKDAVIRYRANPDYWGGKAALDNLIFAITPDASVRWQKLKANECQVMSYPNPADLDAIKADKSVTLMSQAGLNIGYIGFNTEKKPFGDVRVRQALSLAINKKAIIDAVYQGAGAAANGPLPPTLWGYDDSLQGYPYDPEKAKALLKEAGVTNLETDLWAMPVSRPYNPNAKRMAELVQADWKAVGVDARIVSYEWGEYLKRTQAGEPQTFMMGWTADIADPDNFLGVLLGCDAVGSTNRSRWCDQDFDGDIKKAKSITDQTERVKLYKAAQQVFQKEAPWVPIANAVTNDPISNRVKNYKVDPFGKHLFYGVDIE